MNAIEAIDACVDAGRPDVGNFIADLCQLNGVLAAGEARALAAAEGSDMQALARRCHANSANWFPTNHRTQRAAITHCTLGLAGEAGEVANKVKKLYGYVDQTIPDDLRDAIRGELIDTLIYDLVLLDLLESDIPAEIEKVIAKCVARWGEEAA